MRVVVNADDFGMSSETVAATRECFANGSVTSATIMAGMAATAEAIEFARAHPEFSFGVHLTFTGDGAEAPLSSPEAVPSLVGRNGVFPGSSEARCRALLGRLAVGEIAHEVGRQIEAVRDEGVPVSHVDSHRHLHKLGPFREALARVLPALGIRRVRTVQDIYLRRPFTAATYWLGPIWRRRLRAGFASTDHFYMPASTGDVAWEEPLLTRLRNLHGSTLEVGVHPGHEGWRAEERRAVVSFSARARERGHELVTWERV